MVIFIILAIKNEKKTPLGIVPFSVSNDNKKPNFESTTQVDNKSVKIVYPEKNLSQPIVYRVQIAAYKKQVGKDILQELYGVTSLIKEEIIDGLYKYTIGYFATREDADIFRLSCGVYGAFIVTYKNGVRVINKGIISKNGLSLPSK